MQKVAGTRKTTGAKVLPPAYAEALRSMPPRVNAQPRTKTRVSKPSDSKLALAAADISPASTAAVFECIQLLAAADTDLGKDAAFIRQTATRSELNSAQAKACLLFVTRYRHALPPKLTAVSLGEVEATQAKPAEPPESAAKPFLALKQSGRPLTPAERQARWRAARAMASIEVPGDIAERIRLAREARGLSTAELLGLALSALEGENETAASNVSPRRATANARNLRDK